MSNYDQDRKIFLDFVNQVSDWGESGASPETSSLDLKYAFELQHNRLKEKNASIKYNYQPLTANDSTVISHCWSDKEYSNQVAYHRFIKSRNFFVNGKCKAKENQREFFYAVITRMHNQQSDKTYCCPNCGAIHSVKVLLESGCPNCQTRFIMEDLFPKVTNYFTAKDHTQQPGKLKLSLLLFALFGALISLIYTIVNIANTNPDALYLEKTYGDLFFSAVSGAVTGCVFWGLSTVFFVFKDAFKAIPKLVTQQNAKNRLPAFMKQYDPNFSYEYFIGKVIAITRIMVFSSDYSNLAIYEGKPLINSYKGIIDVQFDGAVKLNDYRVEGPYCTLDLIVHTTNTYCKGNRIKKKHEKFRMILSRNILNATDYNFSVKKVQCKNCGASFDATKIHNCPYCSTAYHLGEDDWVVLNFHKA